ncbi:MAG: hypothetical protein ACOC44_05445 [Promethearchaeia archaeon]
MTEQTTQIKSADETENKYIAKLKEIIDENFHKIFNESHLLYTLIFFLSALIISLISLLEVGNIGNIVLFLATTISLTFLFLMVFSRIPQLEDYFFSTEKRFDRHKLYMFLLCLAPSLVIMILYFALGASADLPVEFLGWDLLLPPILIIIYFGWNIIQILFIKTGFEEISLSVNNKVMPSDIDRQKQITVMIVLLVIALIIPILMQIGSLYGLWDIFAPEEGEDPQDPFYWFMAWNVGMFIIIAITSIWLILLSIKSKRNETPNIFSPMFYILIWIIIWYRSFNFIRTFSSEIEAGGTDIFSAVGDILLLVFTAIMVLRSLGGKISTSTFISENNLPFLLYAFTLLYIEGQIILLTGAGQLTGVFSDTNQIKMVTNFLVLLVTLFFYLWYSKYILERKNLIMRSHYTREEVIFVLGRYTGYLDQRNVLQSEKMDNGIFQTFLANEKLKLKGRQEISLKNAKELKAGEISEVSAEYEKLKEESEPSNEIAESSLEGQEEEMMESEEETEPNDIEDTQEEESANPTSTESKQIEEGQPEPKEDN